MTLAHDTDELMDDADFAVPVSIGSTAFTGIFDNGYAEALESFAGGKPTLLCAEADLPAITLGSTTLTVDGDDYTIVERKPDGHGLITLVLEEQ